MLNSKYFAGILVLGMMMALVSCEKVVLDEESIDYPSEQPSGTAQLTVKTRGEGTDENAVAQGRIYIFNQAGECVQMLSTDDENNSATVQMAAGTYTLYAVGGEDLTRFNLPSKSEATSTSVITRVEGKVMDDLLMKQATVTLEDGEQLNQVLSLEHKVICISQLEIKKVPSTVTKVEVTISPIYSTIRLNGTYPDTPTESYKVSLTKQEDGKTWKAQPQQMLFPSKGMPTIKVSITTSEGTVSYSYTASEELPANHHFNISGTYMAAQGVTLTGVLTAAGWGEDREITFDFDDDNKEVVTYNPVAGELCNGYYVVSVNATARTAVLLAKQKLTYEVPATGSAESVWLEALAAPMAALALPENIQGSWRLPTLDEAAVFTQGTNDISFDSSGNSPSYFCLDGGVLKWAYTKQTDSGNVLKSGTNYNGNVLLRPVIDINY